MTGRTALLRKAAECFVEAGAYTDAARCYDALGRLRTSADVYVRAGETERAGEAYRLAGDPEQAARCFRALGLTDRAAACWAEHDRPLDAAWELLLVGRPAGHLLAAAVAAGAPSERLALATGLQEWTEHADPGPAVRALALAEDRLSRPDHRQERQTLLAWSLETAVRTGRLDLGGRLFAAVWRRTERTGTDPELLDQWREWAREHLGGTWGLPSPETAPARTGGTGG
ncbi:hypothetical protein ACFRAR_08075 [Kitasatospora sp. NPDC056651]|uniref:hypothetical protein n=1 Tax=Kitasatospora sp. NPDC056651 TaxID=3345892 RepID=UPI0036A65E57